MAELDLATVREQLDAVTFPVWQGSGAGWELAARRDGAVGIARTLLAEVERLREQNVCLREHVLETVAGWTAASAERDEARAEVERLRELTGTCSCGTSPMTYEGPEPDCAVHGAVRAFNEASAEVERLRAELKAIKGNRLVSAVFGHHKGAPRPFALYRRPGRGLVALGAEFPDGAVALRLANDGGWTTRSEDGADALAADTDTEIVWLSDELEPLAETEQKLDVALAEVERLKAEDRSWADTVLEQRDAAITERDRLRERVGSIAAASDRAATDFAKLVGLTQSAVECERLSRSTAAALRAALDGEELLHLLAQSDGEVDDGGG
jgi:hypothetical protein